MANDYCTIVDFKDWRGGPNDAIDDLKIANAISAASRGIDNFTKTQFWKTPTGTVRLFDTCDTRRLRIGDAVAITEVATDTDADGIFETVWAASDFQLLPLNPAAAPEPEPYTEIQAVGALTFPRRTTTRSGLVKLTGTWGWPSIPAPVFQSALLLVNRLLKRAGSPEGVAGFDDFGVVRISARDDPDAVRYLTPYKTSRRVGGWAIA